MNLITHNVMGDRRGKLVAIESGVSIPFEIKRAFYIYGTLPNVIRGQHAHFKTKQYLIAVSGSCNVILDDGEQRLDYILNRPDIGLFQDAMVWGSMHNFSKDCVLLVFADQNYDPEDYITDYDLFKRDVFL